MHKMIEELEDCPIIAAVKDDEGLDVSGIREQYGVCPVWGHLYHRGSGKKNSEQGKTGSDPYGSNSGVERKRGGGEFFERVYSGGWDYYHQTRADPQGKRVGIVYRASFFCD